MLAYSRKVAERLVAVLAVIGLVAAPVVAVPLDVEGHPQEAVIRTALADGYFQGYRDGLFRPGAPISDGQIATVFRRAFPSGVTRAEMAAVMVAGRAALAPTDRADRPPPSRQREEGLILPSPHLPIIQLHNRMSGWWQELCHITHDYERANERTVDNLRDRCQELAETWEARVLFDPHGSDIEWDSVFVWLDNSDGGPTKLHFRQSCSYYNVTRCRAEGVETLRLQTPTVRNVLGDVRLDVMLECVKYAAWSDSPPLTRVEDIPVSDCYPVGTE